MADRDPVTHENRYPELKWSDLHFPEEFIPIIISIMWLQSSEMYLKEDII